MAASPEFAAHCLELLGALGPARARRMFGGHGFYVEDLFVAVAGGERLYLKVDEHTRERFQAAGCEPFDFDTKEGRKIVLGFWTAPEDALESPALMLPWARLALEAALRARAAKAPKRPAAAGRALKPPPARTKSAGAKKKPPATRPR